MRSADTELRNTIELHAAASEIASPQWDLDAKVRKKRTHFSKRNFKRTIASTKIEKICWQITLAAFIQPLQYYLRDPAAKDKNITHAAAAPSPLTQPFQCDLQPQIQETQRTTHIDTSTRYRTQRRNQFAHETTAAAPAAHTRYLSSPAAATLHGKSQGFVLRLPAQNKAHATFMQPLQYVSQHPVANLHLCSPPPDDNNHAAIPMRSATADSRNA